MHVLQFYQVGLHGIRLVIRHAFLYLVVERYKTQNFTVTYLQLESDL